MVGGTKATRNHISILVSKCLHPVIEGIVLGLDCVLAGNLPLRTARWGYKRSEFIIAEFGNIFSHMNLQAVQERIPKRRAPHHTIIAWLYQRICENDSFERPDMNRGHSEHMPDNEENSLCLIAEAMYVNPKYGYSRDCLIIGYFSTMQTNYSTIIRHFL